MSSRYKKLKRQNFLTRTDKVASSLFAFCKLVSRSGFLVKSSRYKNSRMQNFYSNRHCRFEFILFFANIIEKGFLMSSRYKNSKRQNFLLEQSQSLRFICFFANIIKKQFYGIYFIVGKNKTTSINQKIIVNK